MSTKNYNNKPNRFPVIFSYVDKFSVGGSSINDVDISHSNFIAGKSNPRSKPHQGDRILVTGKTGDDFYIFAAQVNHHVDNKSTKVWANQGGFEWKFNYNITPLSKPTKLSWSDVDRITGASKSQDTRIFHDRFRPQNDGTLITEVGLSRDKIFNYLVKNHK